MMHKRKVREFEVRGIVDNKLVPHRRVRMMLAWTKRRLIYATHEEKLMDEALGVVTRFMAGQVHAQREYPVHLFATMARSLDFYIGLGRLGIEVDGKNHYMQPQAGKDEWSDELMLKHGNILVVRFSNDEVANNIHRCVASIVVHLRDRHDWPKGIKQEFDNLIAAADSKETWDTLRFKYIPHLKPEPSQQKPEPVELTYRQLRSMPLLDQIAHVMNTRTWVKLRRNIKEERGSKCEDCLQSQNVSLDLYHLTYDRIGSERMSDMLLLCKKCRKRRLSTIGVKSA